MDILRKQVPMGAQDFLPEECAAKKKLEQGLRAVFLNNGFEEIETPAFEYYDVFRAGMSPDMQEGTIKFFDAKGADFGAPARPYRAGGAARGDENAKKRGAKEALLYRQRLRRARI